MTNTNQQPGLSKEQIDSVVKLYSNRQYQEAIDQIKSLNEYRGGESGIKMAESFCLLREIKK